MLKLLSKLGARQQTRRQSAYVEYADLLAKLASKEDHEPTDKDIERLDNLSLELGFTHEQIDEHVAAMKRIQELTPLVDGMQDSIRKLEHAKAEWEKHRELVRNEVEKRRLEDLQFSDRHAKAMGVNMQSNQAIQELADLRRKHPFLFGEVPQPKVEKKRTAANTPFQ